MIFRGKISPGAVVAAPDAKVPVDADAIAAQLQPQHTPNDAATNRRHE